MVCTSNSIRMVPRFLYLLYLRLIYCSIAAHNMYWSECFHEMLTTVSGGPYLLYLGCLVITFLLVLILNFLSSIINTLLVWSYYNMPFLFVNTFLEFSSSIFKLYQSHILLSVYCENYGIFWKHLLFMDRTSFRSKTLRNAFVPRNIHLQTMR